MRYIASLILACCLVSPAFAGQEFCQISNSGNCIAHNQPQAANPANLDAFTNSSLAQRSASSKADGSGESNHSEYALLDLDLVNTEIPSTPR